MDKFETVKHYLQELNLEITKEIPEEKMVIIKDEEQGIKDLVIDCEEPILVLEQFITKLENPSQATLKRLLQINRNLVHGAFVLSEEGDNLLFRDTLQLENLDQNEIEGTVNALSLALAEYAGELIKFSNEK